RVVWGGCRGAAKVWMSVLHVYVFVLQNYDKYSIWWNKRGKRDTKLCRDAQFSRPFFVTLQSDGHVAAPFSVACGGGGERSPSETTNSRNT
ncbi:MAG: hypothetical protein Q4E71_06945, partial [Prevotella sp.]|nr:hypothetical protein [Prevotella sp.]